MAARDTTPRPLLREGALYFADGGRVVCVRCAGASARYTGRDISGQKVARVTVEDVRAWPDDLGSLRCASGCTSLTAVAGPDGWPLERGDVW